MKRRRKWNLGMFAWLLPLVLVIAAVCFATALDSLNQGREEESVRQLEQTLRRGCVACYAAEGFYPPDLEYLEEHYGIQIKDSGYIVRYMTFGENLMPDITVLERTQ